MTETLKTYDAIPSSVTEFTGKRFWVAKDQDLRAIDSVLALESGFRMARAAVERVHEVMHEVVTL